MSTVIDKIKGTSIRSLLMVKLPRYLYRKSQIISWMIFGKLPKSYAWKGQWYAYEKIKNRYLRQTYDINSLFPELNPCIDKKNIWIYWNSGFHNAPDLVKKCHKQLIENIPIGYKLHFITESNVSDYVIMPDFIKKKLSQGIMTQTQFSDILRTALLYRYGGIWMDATCFLSQPIPNKVLNAQLFMFQANKLPLTETYPPIKCSSWFIATNETENYLLSRVLQVVLYYWQTNNHLIHYYLYHIALSALVDVDEKCKDIWSNVPYVCNMNPHVLWFEFFEDYTPTRWDNAVESCFVHKLSYKFKAEALSCKKENLIQHFMKEY